MPETALFAGDSLPSSFDPALERYFQAFAALPSAFQFTFAAIIGLVIGSFLSVVIHRLPIMLERAWRNELAALNVEDAASVGPEDHDDAKWHDTSAGMADEAGAAIGHASAPYNLWLPRSACPHCGHTLRAWENVPLLSYLLLRGRCRACDARISALYPAMEVTTAMLAMLLLWRDGPGWAALAGFGLASALLALALIDARTHLLPDSLTLPLIWAGLLVNLSTTFATLHSAVVGAAAGYAFLWLVYWAFRLIRGKEGIGYGDFKLLAALGAWFGWQALPQLVLISAVLGALWGVLALLLGRMGRDQPLPFGPFLAVAGIATLLFGMPLYGWLGG